MHKGLNVFILVLFIAIAALAPFVTAKESSFSFNKTAEECSESFEKDLLEKAFHKEFALSIIKLPFVLTNSFPSLINLKPQLVGDDFLRPPLAA